MDIKGRILTIAGSDSSGGAGIQADVKTITALGGYAMTAITAVTAQNTQKVYNIHPIPADIVGQQIACVTRDIGVEAIKTGMLYDSEIIQTVAQSIKRYVGAAIPLIVDPVILATSGDRLLEKEAIETLKTELIPLARLITPNILEAQLLSGQNIKTHDDVEMCGYTLLGMGCGSVLIKGGHLQEEKVADCLITHNKVIWFSDDRVPSNNTHGTGCTLSAAIACFMAQGMNMKRAIQAAKNYVTRAIKDAPDFVNGHGPLNHIAMNQLDKII